MVFEVLTAMLLVSVPADASDLSTEVSSALRRATAYMRDSVSTRGGYLWAYSRDLSIREGEFHPALQRDRATASQIWVQPPGTPAMGLAFLDFFRTTGDSLYLFAARDAADALIWGQLAVGGWEYSIDFDSSQAAARFYRRNHLAGEQRGTRSNIATLDDNTTQSALTFLIKLDETIGFSEPVHSAALYGLESVLSAQFANGAWPQRYGPEGASADWGYSAYYTFNDQAINKCITLMLTAHRVYRKERFLQSAKRGGEFIIASQQAPPQEGWAEQYDWNMRPAAARSFEPPAISSAATASNILTLIELYVETGEERFLRPIPSALAWFGRSAVDIPPEFFVVRNTEPYQRGWARFYELGTNRPLFGDRDGQVHYTFGEISEERQKGYSWYGRYGDAARRSYEQLMARGRDEFATERAPLVPDPANTQRAHELEPVVRSILSEMDNGCRWVDADGMIRMKTFLNKTRLLNEFLLVSRGAELSH